jgi:hypothetical protein
MKPLKQVIYLTPDEIDQIVADREAEASQMQPGTARRSILVEVSRLRSYADMKRLLTVPPKADAAR